MICCIHTAYNFMFLLYVGYTNEYTLKVCSSERISLLSMFINCFVGYLNDYAPNKNYYLLFISIGKKIILLKAKIQ